MEIKIQIKLENRLPNKLKENLKVFEEENNSWFKRINHYKQTVKNNMSESLKLMEAWGSKNAREGLWCCGYIYGVVHTLGHQLKKKVNSKYNLNTWS